MPPEKHQPALGSVDFTLQLSQTGNGLSGYVSLEKTLIFSVEHTIAGQVPLEIEPYVTDNFDGTKRPNYSGAVTALPPIQLLCLPGRPRRHPTRLRADSHSTCQSCGGSNIGNNLPDLGD